MRLTGRTERPWTETMDFWTVLKASARRWYVFLPILGAALLIGNAQVGSQPPVYTATSSAALTGPALVPGTEPGQIVEVNPFQTLSGSLSTTTGILVSLMDSTPKRDQFAADGVDADYVVSVDSSVIYFDVTGSDAAAVTASAARLVELADTEVAALQSKPVESPESRIRAVPLALPVVADEDTTAGLRLLALVGLLGLVAATGGAVAFDGIARVRAKRAAEHHDTHHDDVLAATSWTESDEHASSGASEVDDDARAADTVRRHHGLPPGARHGDERQDDGLRREIESIGRLEPDTDTVIIADGPVTAPAARHGRHD
jgi:hypothetical protein